jgi:hypothetical protein
MLVFTMRIGGLALVALALRTHVRPNATGIGAGLAALLLFVAYRNRNFVATCPVERRR